MNLQTNRKGKRLKINRALGTRGIVIRNPCPPAESSLSLVQDIKDIISQAEGRGWTETQILAAINALTSSQAPAQLTPSGASFPPPALGVLAQLLQILQGLQIPNNNKVTIVGELYCLVVGTGSVPTYTNSAYGQTSAALPMNNNVALGVGIPFIFDLGHVNIGETVNIQQCTALRLWVH